MWPFKHKHKQEIYPGKGSKLITKTSLLTYVPIITGKWAIYRCRCGEIMQERFEISGAGSQQLDWGAIYDSLWDEGPIRSYEQNLQKMQQRS